MMKPRMLLVDDEAGVLEELERSLRPLRQEWEMEFVGSGLQALARLAERRFDAVVSDLHMPAMNGAELLEEVMKQNPQTVRIILSGHADNQLICQCAGVIHQFLAKPCDPETLRTTLAWASAVETILPNQKLKALIARMDRLPTVPSLYLEIVEALRNPESSLEAIGGIIAKDIAMTAKILRLVNSAFFGLRRRLADPIEASLFLGLGTVRSLVLSINAFAQFESSELRKFSLSALWSHSLEAAAIAKEIARVEQAGRQLADEAFVAGMLHDVGKLVLAANFADQFTQVLQLVWEQHQEPAAAEQQIFGANHADVGGYLLGLWGLPLPVVEAIALHHCPERAPQKTFSPLAAVHVADALVHQRAPRGQGAASRMNRAYLEELGLTDRLPIWEQSLPLVPSAPDLS